MDNQIVVQVKQVYGKDTVYPYCGKAKLFATIAGTVTLTKQTLTAIKGLGFTIKQRINDYQGITI